MDGTEPVPSCGVENAEPGGGREVEELEGAFETER
jgi:hypothetical protein